jgi:hypothetical protein
LIVKSGDSISALPKVARACGCPPILIMVREIGKVTGVNPSSRFSGLLPNRGHLEATTVRAFLVLFRLSKSRGY